jgi:Flp pilus assembly protein TadG
MFRTILLNQKGTIGVLFALAVIPLLIAGGGAADYMSAVFAKARMQAAIDAGVLAGAALVDANAGERIQYAKDVANENLRQAGIDPQGARVSVSASQGKVNGSIEADSRTYFLSVINIGALPVRANAEAQFAVGVPAEIVFVLDNSTSMGWAGAFDDLTISAKQFVDDIFAGGSDDVRVGIVPFAARVNIGTTRGSWLASPPGAGWNGCVDPRYEPVAGEPHRLTDSKASVSSFSQSPLGVPVAYRTAGARQLQDQCPSELLPLSNDAVEIKNKIDSLARRFGTRMDLGMAWGWRVISPNWKGEWGDPQSPNGPGSDEKKAIVLITDGYSYPIFDPMDDGLEGPSTIQPEHDASLLAVCDRVKAQEIEIFVLFLTGKNSVIPTYKQCATSQDNHFFHVGNRTELSDALSQVRGQTATLVRLTK